MNQRKLLLPILLLIFLGTRGIAMTTQQEELFEAVSKPNDLLQGKVMLLLANGVNPNIKRFDPPLDKAIGSHDQEDTPLHIAILNGNLVSTDLLLIKNAYVNAKNIDGHTPLHNAIFLAPQTAAQIIDLLYKYHADFNAEDEYGNTPLGLAIQLKKFTIADQLIKLGANINKQNRYKDTLLHRVVKENNVEGIKYLLQKNVRRNLKNKNFKPLELALHMDYHDIALLLLFKI